MLLSSSQDCACRVRGQRGLTLSLHTCSIFAKRGRLESPSRSGLGKRGSNARVPRFLLE